MIYTVVFHSMILSQKQCLLSEKTRILGYGKYWLEMLIKLKMNNASKKRL